MIIVKITKKYLIVILILLIFLVLWWIFASVSDSIAISLAGGRTNASCVQTITHAWDDVNGEYKVIRTETNDEGSRPMLLHLKKNALGFWAAERVKAAAPDDLWAGIGWFEDAEGYVGVSDAVHIVYAGHDDLFVGILVRPLGRRIRPGKAGGMEFLHALRRSRALPHFLQQAADGIIRRMRDVVQTLQLFGQTVLFRG